MHATATPASPCGATALAMQRQVDAMKVAEGRIQRGENAITDGDRLNLT
jgi:hypothetical protein